MTKDDSIDAGRRGFLKLAGAAAPAVAVAAATGGAGEASAEAAPEGAGLRETAHVKQYWDSARF